MRDITQVLEAVRTGKASAQDLIPLVYEDLRRVAAARMVSQPAGHTLQPTELVHGAWMRLNGDRVVGFEGRTHFFAAASEAMRHILVDHARRKQAMRHGGGLKRTAYFEADLHTPQDDEQVLAVDEALEALSLEHKLGAELVKLRFFGGMTLDDAAQALGISQRTADSYWAFAKAWLFRRMVAQRG